ncbi:MAG: flagellar biosynthetic protein FliR [Hungatella sp.]
MIDMPDLLLFSLITMRVSGFILLNPIFGRKTIPTMVKAGFIMVLSVSMLTYTQGQGITVEIAGPLAYGILLLKEFLMGFVLGYVVSLFFYVAAYAGGIIDFNIGMSMASVYDPQNNTTMPLTGTIMNAMIMLLFFAVDGHLALFKILAESEQVIPYGQVMITNQAMQAVLDIFQECTLLAVKLSFPIVALELLVEIGVGVLMKVIPQINVFVVNIQIKVLVGNFLLLLMCIPFGEFFGDLVNRMVDTVSFVLTLL